MAKAKITVKGSELRQKFHDVQNVMQEYCIAQSEMIDALVLSVLSGNHCLLYGPWGVNKTGALNLFTRLLGCDQNGSSMFTVALDKYTAPEALLGPISAKKLLEEDTYERNLRGTICDAPFAFINEIFSGNSATRRSLLSVLNEGYIDNGGRRVPVRLLTMFCDSNDLPMQQTDKPFYDRILLRVHVTYIPLSDADAFIDMLDVDAPRLAGADALAPIMSLLELKASKQLAARVRVPDVIKGMLHEMRQEFVSKLNMTLSDRRWKRSLDVLRASAWLRGSQYVEPADLYALRHVLWDREEQIASVRDALGPYKGKTLAEGELTAVEEAKKTFDFAKASGDAQTVRQAYEALVVQRESFVTSEALSRIDEMITDLSAGVKQDAQQANDALAQLMSDDATNFEEVCVECGRTLDVAQSAGNLCPDCERAARDRVIDEQARRDVQTIKNSADANDDEEDD